MKKLILAWLLTLSICLPLNSSEYLSKEPIVTLMNNEVSALIDELLQTTSLKAWEFQDQMNRQGIRITDHERTSLLLRNYLLAYTKPPCFEVPLETIITKVHSHITKSQPEKHVYHYPWHTLEEELNQEHKEHIYLLSYGSLMNSKTVSGYVHPIGLAFGFGIKRVFEYVHPKPHMSCIGLPDQEHPEEELRLNVAYTGKVHDVVNCVLSVVDKHTIDNVRSREVGYDLIKVPFVTQMDATEEEPYIDYAYVLSAPSGHQRVTKVDTKKPHLSYLNLSVEGLLHRGGSTPLFFTKTYLADHKTTVLEWLIDELHQLKNQENATAIVIDETIQP